MGTMRRDRHDPESEPHPPAGPSALRLALSAAPVLHRADGSALPLATRDAALLAWLALEGATPRTRLAQLLWPDSDSDSARNALRQRLFHLRRQAGDGLVAGTAMLSLAEGVEHDLSDSDSVLGESRHDFGAELSAWLEQQRGRRRARMRQSLVDLCDMAAQAGDHADALSHARELLALEPLSEEAHRRVMRLHYLAGDRAAALQAFDRCEQLLKDEVGARPSGETLALLATIEQSNVAQPGTVGGAVPASVLRPPRLIGRDAEWQALLLAWQAPAVLKLSGEAGMGKTRLLNDLAQRHGSAAVKVSARPGDTSVPYAVMARLLRAWLALAPTPLAERDRHELARLLPELGEPPAADERRELALRDALDTALTQAAAGGMAGVLVDDLHFADAASLETLQQLCGSQAMVAWVLAFRAAELSPAGLSLVNDTLQEARSLALAPLSLDAVAELVDTLGIDGLSGATLAAPLLRHTGGNPLYLLETVKALHQQGLAATPDGTGPALPSARNVVQLIGRRLTQLSPGALKLARCAAVAGQDFSTTLATQVLEAGPLDLADAWAELEAAQVLRDAAFAHDLIHDAALATVPPALARRLHALIAQSLAVQGAAPQRLAAHWVASDLPHHAVPWLQEAGRQAALALRPDEACAAYLKAADLLQAQGRDGEAFQSLLTLLTQLYAPATQEIQSVLERMDQLAADPHERALVAERRSDVLSRQGDFAGAGQVAQQALATLTLEAHPALASRLLCNVAAADLAQGQHDRAIERMHRAEDLAARSDDVDSQCQAAHYFGSVLDHAHRYAEAYRAHRRTYELLLELRRAPMELISVASNIAGNRTQLGLFDAALEMVQVCYRIAGEGAIDLASQWPSLRVHHAYTLLGLARYTEAVHCFEQAQVDISTHMPGWLPAVHNMTAMLWMQLGQWARARQAVDAALAGATSLPRYHARALRLRAQIAVALRESPDAGLAEQIEASGESAGPLVQHQDGLARTLVLPPGEAYALACRTRDDALARQMPNHVLEAETRCAGASLRAGLHEQAARHAREALKRLREVTPTGFYRGEVWLVAAQALAPTAPIERQRVLDVAAAWIHETARLRVPAEFRDSFLHRNPVNRELIALAARPAAT
jgi:DNA-binding SARP family transcriptional activator